MKPPIAGKLSRDSRGKLLDILAVNHSHSEMTQWAFCKTCQDKFQKYKLEKSKLTDLERDQLNKEVVARAKKIDPDIIKKMLEQRGDLII